MRDFERSEIAVEAQSQSSTSRNLLLNFSLPTTFTPLSAKVILILLRSSMALGQRHSNCTTQYRESSLWLYVYLFQVPIPAIGIRVITFIISLRPAVVYATHLAFEVINLR